MPSPLQESFEKFYPQYLQALKDKDHDFLKKVYPPDFFQLMSGDPTYKFELLNADGILEVFGGPQPTMECEGSRCALYGKGGKEQGSRMFFTLLNDQWVGYDAQEAERMMKIRENIEKFKYDYQISFSAFGPAKYEVMLNGDSVEQLVNYENGHSVSFIPFTLKTGENVLKITALADPSRGKPNEKTTVSYEIYRFPKGNTDENALFDKNNILVRSGDPGSDLSLEDVQVGPEGFSREVKFMVE